MKLSMFTMPLHPPSRDFTEVLKEDRDAVILADHLGFDEAFIGEHVTDQAEPITSSLIFISGIKVCVFRSSLNSRKLCIFL